MSVRVCSWSSRPHLALYPRRPGDRVHPARLPGKKCQARRLIDHREQLAFIHRAVTEAAQHHVVYPARERVVEAETLFSDERRGLELAESELRAVARKHALEQRDDFVRLHGGAEAKAFRLRARPGIAAFRSEEHTSELQSRF